MKKPAGANGAKLKLLASMLMFGTIGIFVRYIPLPSSVIALARGVIGTLFLLLTVLARRSRVSLPHVRRNLPTLCLAGLCLGFNWILLFEAYRFTGVAVATLCYYVAPVIVILVSPLLFRERLTLVKGLCAAAALLGMALVCGVLEPSAAGPSATGVLLGLGAAALYAGVMLLNKRLSAISAYDRTIVQLAVSAVVLLPYTLLTADVSALSLTPSAAVLLLTVGIVHTGVAYALYFGSLGDLKAQTVAIFSYLDPVVAILLSALLLRERMSLPGVAGAVLVLGATLLCEILEGRQKKPAGSE